MTWTPQPALTDLAGSGAQFLGVAAGPGGYLVVGKDGGDGQARVALWWSADLKNWVNGETSGGAGSFAAAAVAVGNGFVAAGSENNCHTIWTSPDGRNWTAHDLAKPSGATTATLGSIAVNQGGRFVAAGYATNSAGDLPIVVTSADGGAHVTQVVLSAPQGQATVTAVTATGDGFAAVGLAGPANAQHPVEWTSPDGVTWSAAHPAHRGRRQRDHGPERHGHDAHRHRPARRGLVSPHDSRPAEPAPAGNPVCPAGEMSLLPLGAANLTSCRGAAGSSRSGTPLIDASSTSAVCAVRSGTPLVASSDEICSVQPGLAEISSDAPESTTESAFVTRARARLPAAAGCRRRPSRSTSRRPAAQAAQARGWRAAARAARR